MKTVTIQIEGPPGSGKTLLADVIQKHLLNKGMMVGKLIADHQKESFGVTFDPGTLLKKPTP